MTNAQRNEALRRAALEVLAPRHPAALHARAIRRRIETESLVDGPFDDFALESALAFLEQKGWCKIIVDSLGSTKFYQATAPGVLAHERGSLDA